MLAAQLHNKLTRNEEDLEDLLTSNVFGSIKYVPQEYGLIPLLSAAEGLNDKNPFIYLPPISNIEYDFWQRLKEENCYACEPDVLIHIEHTTGTQTTILVEAKFKSGKSSEADDGDKPNDQLAREWDNLIAYTTKKKSNPYLLYITADFGHPMEDIEASKSDYFRTRGKEMEIFWLSWRKLPTIFHNSKYDILKDLVEVLRQQWLIFFEGVTGPENLSNVNWQFQNTACYDWTTNFSKIEWRF